MTASRHSSALAHILVREMQGRNIPTFAALGKLAKIPPESISRWVNEHTSPQVTSLNRLAAALRPDSESRTALLGELASATR